MKTIWNKFWNDEAFFFRAVRGIGISLGVFITTGGLAVWGIPEEAGTILTALSAMFSGGSGAPGKPVAVGVK